MTRRYSKGISGSGSFTYNRVTENRTVEEYDREPTLWQTNSNGRPWRVTGLVVYDLPFGPGRKFLSRRRGPLEHRSGMDGRRHV